MSESDGVEEALETVMRSAVMAAAQMGERRAREREAAACAAQSRSVDEAREFGRRLEAERATARAVLAPTSSEAWWDTATPEQVSGAYERATSWADTDPEVATAKAAMDEQLRRRYGINPNAGANAATLGRAQESARQRGTAAGENAEATALLAVVDRLKAEADRTQRTDIHRAAEAERGEGEASYDSAERREWFAQSMLDAGVNPDLVDDRIIADVSQGAPATDATGNVGRRPRERRTRGAASGVSRVWSGRGR